MQAWIVPTVAVVLALVALALVVALVRARSRTDRQVAEQLGRSRAEAAELREQLAALERRLDRRDAPSIAPQTSFVITDLGHERPESEPPAQVDSALFADLVLRETVVKAASLAHGVRRALDPETRNRIRFEMRREVKRARKQRKADTREARREWAARQRATVDEGGSAA